ncbi:Mitogen-activated protein kinase kinase kinase [Musa troglodytarum]|uniref:mitogen-activated protein kinase kinase kinase n=1 Tax=Musa troglodytarum TaxID=320322 RepID=A0A9E7GRU8_9LILI|nr:Mitogen-activated protein kinase kinase kinase [Musa troglodytarum]
MLFFGRKEGAFRLGRGGMDSKLQQERRQKREEEGRQRRLERRNATKNFDYGMAAGGVSWSSSSSSSCSSCHALSDESAALQPTRSLDLPYSNQTSFRIAGSIDGEVDILCRTLGLSGPEDFAIPLLAWEARKVRSSSDLLHKRSPIFHTDSPTRQNPTLASRSRILVPDSSPTVLPSPPIEEATGRQDVGEATPVKNSCDSSMDEIAVADDEAVKNSCPSPISGGGGIGIQVVRPPVLTPTAILLSSQINSILPTPPLALPPPPSMSLRAIDRMGSAWDIVRSFAPDEEASDFGACPRKSSTLAVDVDEEDERDLIRQAALDIVRSFAPDEEASDFGAGPRKSSSLAVDVDEEDERVLIGRAVGVEEFEELRLGETLEGFTGTSLCSPMNDDDTRSMTTKTMFNISPNGKFKRKIKSWMQGLLLGSGSYGKVYEGISDDGVFFAVKEVSLLDQGINAPQCILQLEQEVALLSQFEHENIVQYYGTDKESSKLFIFLELVTQGSLASLYQKYHLRDTQVSAYTWQILHGLNYLHERNVVHRDIKCANILVHANGSVKLADFGLAKEITKFDMLKSCKGSVYWMAPEVVNPKKTYGPACDIWSLGCTVLEMLTRQIPYPSLEWTQALFKIGRGEQPPIPNYLSRDARDFISQCVKANPDDRPSASQLLEHPFVKRSLPISTDSKSSLHLHKEI